MQQMQQVEPAVGGRYRVIRPAESVEDIDGSLVTFAPVEFVAVILEKPDKVIAFDGYKKKGVFGKECVQILGVGIESSCLDSDYSEHAKLEE